MSDKVKQLEERKSALEERIEVIDRLSVDVQSKRSDLYQQVQDLEAEIEAVELYEADRDNSNVITHPGEIWVCDQGELWLRLGMYVLANLAGGNTLWPDNVNLVRRIYKPGELCNTVYAISDLQDYIAELAPENEHDQHIADEINKL